jgi:hypothetical protein
VKIVRTKGDKRQGEAVSILLKTKLKKETLPALIEALKEVHPNPKEEPWQVIGIAQDLWELGPDAKEAAPLLEKRLKGIDPDADICLYQGARTLLKLEPGNQLARNIFLAQMWMLKHDLLLHAHSLEDKKFSPSPEFVKDALFPIEVSKLLGPDAKPLIPALEKLVETDNRDIREAAKAALKVIRGKD